LDGKGKSDPITILTTDLQEFMNKLAAEGYTTKSISPENKFQPKPLTSKPLSLITGRPGQRFGTP